MNPELFDVFKKGYNGKMLVKDLLAGLMVAIIALPLSAALGIQSGSTLQAGLITAIFAGFCISAFGGSRFQIGGPTAAFVAILFSYLNNPEIGISGLVMAGILAGVILIVMGIFKLGKAVKFVPYPIVVGFTAGIGVTLLFGQLKDFLGIDCAVKGEFIEKLIEYVNNISTISIASVIIGVFSLAIIIFLPKINKKIPASFVAIIAATLLSLLLGVIDPSLSAETIGSKYGEIKGEFSFDHLGGFENVNFGAIIMPAIIIAFLCAIESLLSATVADEMADTKHNPNRELVGQGVANIVSSLMGGLPATGAIARTAANIDAGAASPISGMIHSVCLLVFYLLLMPVMQYIPLAALAAVLIMVAYKMSNFKLLYRLASFTKRDTAVLVVTFLLTIFFDLTYGVLGGLALAIIVNAKNLFKKLVIEESVDGESKIATLSLSGALYFFAVNKLVNRIMENAKSCDTIRVDMNTLDRVDVTSVEKLAKLDKKLNSEGKNLVLLNTNEIISKRYHKFVEEVLK